MCFRIMPLNVIFDVMGGSVLNLKHIIVSWFVVYVAVYVFMLGSSTTISSVLRFHVGSSHRAKVNQIELDELKLYSIVSPGFKVQ